MKNFIIFFILLFFIFIFEKYSFSIKDEYEIFKDIVQKNSCIVSIDADIVQYIREGDNREETFKGRFRAEDNNFRIDYFFPERQMVLNYSGKLIWYYPESKILYNISTSGNTKSALIINPLSKFSSNLKNRFEVKNISFSFYSILKFSEKYEIFDKINKYKIFLWIDRDKKYILKKIITDIKNKELVKEIYDDHEKIDGIYFPKVVEVYVRRNKGVTSNITRYNNIKLNRKISKSVFDFKFPENVKKQNY
jgi:outer membrane lipoprotein-sorting protein